MKVENELKSLDLYKFSRIKEVLWQKLRSLWYAPKATGEICFDPDELNDAELLNVAGGLNIDFKRKFEVDNDGK